MTWEIRQGRNLDLLAEMPDGSVQTCVTSPPYWGLRDYGEDDQLGLEPTPEEYVANMVAVFREVRRVLRNDGTLWLNLGDSYFGAGRGPSNVNMEHGLHQAQTANGGFPTRGVYSHELIKPKDLVGIPWRVAFALQADGWYLRSDIIWHKPNPMPESVTDRPTKSHEYIFLLTKQPRYYYDAHAIREEAVARDLGEMDGGAQRNGNGSKANEGRNFRTQIRFGGSKYGDSDDPHHATKSGNPYEFTGYRNKRSVWTVTTKPFSGAHFAVFPPDLIEPCVLAGASFAACSDCGAPYKRITERRKSWESNSAKAGNRPEGKYGPEHQGDIRMGPTVSVTTKGWEPGCECPGHPSLDDNGRSTVLDPFSGSGTTGMVALRHGRSYIGLELNPDYAEMSRNRIRDDAPLLNTGQEVAA